MKSKLIAFVAAATGWALVAGFLVGLIGRVPERPAQPLSADVAIAVVIVMTGLMVLAYFAGQAAAEEDFGDDGALLDEALDALHELEDEAAIHLRLRDERGAHVVKEAQRVLLTSGRGVKGWN
jgi:hypothetical protein